MAFSCSHTLSPPTFLPCQVWMLTGDKAETATCIARSARLVDRGQEVFSISVNNVKDAQAALDQFGAKPKTPLVIDGPSLQVCMLSSISDPPAPSFVCLPIHCVFERFPSH